VDTFSLESMEIVNQVVLAGIEPVQFKWAVNDVFMVVV
jgi:hypothetical protein